MFYFLNAMQSNTRTVKPVCNGHPCDPNFEAIVIGALSSGLDLSTLLLLWKKLKQFSIIKEFRTNLLFYRIASSEWYHKLCRIIKGSLSSSAINSSYNGLINTPF